MEADRLIKDTIGKYGDTIDDLDNNAGGLVARKTVARLTPFRQEGSDRKNTNCMAFMGTWETT